jgi:hypothetical protein
MGTPLPVDLGVLIRLQFSFGFPFLSPIPYPEVFHVKHATRSESSHSRQPLPLLQQPIRSLVAEARE